VDGAHASGVLRRQRRDRRHAKTAEGRKRFQVSLNASPAAAVRASDGEEAGVLVRLMFSGLIHGLMTKDFYYYCYS
jgi:hypothetical protein